MKLGESIVYRKHIRHYQTADTMEGPLHSVIMTRQQVLNTSNVKILGLTKAMLARDNQAEAWMKGFVSFDGLKRT